MQYYLIKDLNQLGRIENHIPYIYHKGKGWLVDHDNILMDRVIGYDGQEIGSASMLTRVDDISEEDAQEYIREMQ